MDRLEELEAQRLALKVKLVDAEGAGAAAVSRELRAVMSEIAGLARPAEGARFQGRGDELAPRRSAGKPPRATKGRATGRAAGERK